jgi:outer membrane lipoprotein SlyB
MRIRALLPIAGAAMVAMSLHGCADSSSPAGPP